MILAPNKDKTKENKEVGSLSLDRHMAIREKSGRSRCLCLAASALAYSVVNRRGGDISKGLLVGTLGGAATGALGGWWVLPHFHGHLG